jgi:hypothetical protein
MCCHGPAATDGLFRGEKYFQRTFADSIVGSPRRKLRKRPKTRAPNPIPEASPRQPPPTALNDEIRSKPVAREWHLRGNEGHDGLITAGYRSSHSRRAA